MATGNPPGIRRKPTPNVAIKPDRVRRGLRHTVVAIFASHPKHGDLAARVAQAVTKHSKPVESRKWEHVRPAVSDAYSRSSRLRRERDKG